VFKSFVNSEELDFKVNFVHQLNAKLFKNVCGPCIVCQTRRSRSSSNWQQSLERRNTSRREVHSQCRDHVSSQAMCI
jgi:hypothetical protein